MKFYANAKVNLALDVVGKRDDGYHEINMIMQEISLCDEIDINLRDDTEINLTVANAFLPYDENNIAYRAAALFYKESGISGGCDISLVKNIPICAGLGGGSTDAACVLKALNKMHANPLSESKLLDIGLKLGADVPFCIMGGTAHAGGIGERLVHIDNIFDRWVVLIKPDIDISTPEAYQDIDNTEIRHPDIEKTITALAEGDISAFKASTGNVFEYVSIPKHPIISEIKAHLIDFGADFAMMSGSGPTVFGLFGNKEQADTAYASYVDSCQGGGICRFIKNK